MDERSVSYYGAYYGGALVAATKIAEEYVNRPCERGNKPYREAEIRLITSGKRQMQHYLDGVYRIHYRNHECNKKGQVVKCEAYFADENGNEIK